MCAKAANSAWKQIPTSANIIHDMLIVDKSAYRERHNTQTALHKVLDDWYYDIADGLLTSVCSFDINKCFDTINHFILFKKMEKYGFASDTANWFWSYLLDRQQLVSCHNKLSGKRQLNIGVPQGSVLRPILFLLSPCHLVPSSRIRLLATAVAAPLHPALSLAYRLMVLMVAPLEYPMSVSSHVCRGLPLLLAPFILPSITSSSIPPALTTCPK